MSGTNIDDVPDELLLEILARVPADDRHHIAKVVCRRWRHIIHSDYLIKTQLRHSGYGIIFSFSDHPSFVTAEQGGIETYHEVSCKVPTGFKLMGSCNGLVLLRQCHDMTTLSVTNPVTGQQFITPPFPFADRTGYHGCGIGYAADSMEYKVVQPYATVEYKVCLAILSLGSDKPWRNVGVEHLSSNARQHLISPTLATEGFITWTYYAELSYLTLDLETEILTFHPNPLPEACLVGTYSAAYLSTGRSLSLVVGHTCPKYLMEVWEMMAESGKWRKLVGDIKLGAHERWLQQQFVNPGYNYPFPLGWVRYPEILALRGGSSCILFNLKTQQISSMEMSGHLYNKFAHPHKKTRTWFT